MNNTNQTQEEIDIVQFFNTTGRMFKSFFSAIFGPLNWLFYLFLDLLVLIKKNYLYFGGAVLAGLILSFIPKEGNVTMYEAQVQVRTNYNAQVALQEKIDLYNDLIRKDDFDNLAQELQLQPETAKHFMTFELTPIINDVFLIKDYENYLMNMDTVVYKYLKYSNYKKNISKNENLINYWEIEVRADQPNVFKNLNNAFKNLFKDDVVIQQKAKNHMATLQLSKQKILKSINDIDTLRSVLDKAMLQLSANPSGGTNMMVAGEKLRGPEGPYNLFSERIKLLKQLSMITSRENNYGSAVILMNAFPLQGVKVTSLVSNIHFLYPLYGFLLVLVVLWLIRFNKYLGEYQKNKSS